MVKSRNTRRGQTTPPPGFNERRKERERQKGDKAGQSSENSHDSQEGCVIGTAETRQVWLELRDDEKAQVLAVEVKETGKLLRQWGYMESEAQMEQVLTNPEAMTAIRLMVSTALSEGDGVVKTGTDDVALRAILKTFESHLADLHNYKVLNWKLLLLMLFFGFTSSWHWLVRVVLLPLLVVVWLYIGEATVHLFANPDPHRVRTRLNGIFTALFCFSLGDWLPWYQILVLLCLLPVVVVEAGQLCAKAESQGLEPVTRVLSGIAALFVPYLTWYSTWAFLYCSFFFFPTAACFITSKLLVLLLIVLRACSFCQQLMVNFFIQYTTSWFGASKRLCYWGSLLASIVLFYFSWGSWWSLVNLVFFLSLVPSDLTDVVSLSVQSSITHLMSDFYIGTLLTRIAQILIVLVSLAAMVAAKLCRKEKSQ
mmetsp:Transcript_13062/g.25322  ORF Transcript_13062/g.25322 Transcript_13062/m.25322 type:complete len:425 (+) Transcript_13062:16-1290(+)